MEPIVKPWLNQDFVLEEDGDLGHGTSKSNIVRTWKEKHGLESYFNCASSPDLLLKENCWAIPKQHLRKYSHWDNATTAKLIVEGWSNVNQLFINEKVASIPDRLKAVIEGDGQMTGY